MLKFQNTGEVAASVTTSSTFPLITVLVTKAKTAGSFTYLAPCSSNARIGGAVEVGRHIKGFINAWVAWVTLYSLCGVGEWTLIMLWESPF